MTKQKQPTITEMRDTLIQEITDKPEIYPAIEAVKVFAYRMELREMGKL